jgi:hypothetical protein
VLARVVILRGCDFFDFSQKVALKTTGLDAKKSSYRNKVTSSERSGRKFLIGALGAPSATKSKNPSASFSGYGEGSGEILRRPAESAGVLRMTKDAECVAK